MGTKKGGGIPSRLESTRRRFERWRRTRKVRSRIPESLWAAAVKLADTYGVHRTAKSLGLDYYALKKRLQEGSASQPAMTASANGPTFVELASPARMGTPECILELEDARGAKMRIQIKGGEAPDLAALSRSFWAGKS
jgi:hypothetical protein